MPKKRKKLGEMLVDWGIIDVNALANALQYAKEHNKRIGEALVETELCSEDDVAKALATQFGLEYIDLDHHPVNREILSLIPAKLSEDYLVLPLGEEGDRLKVIITRFGDARLAAVSPQPRDHADAGGNRQGEAFHRQIRQHGGGRAFQNDEEY